MINPQWTSVGLGLARTSEKTFKITEVYAGISQFQPVITDEVITALKSQIVLEVITQYSYIQNQNVRLTNALNQWLGISIEEQAAISFGDFLENEGFNDFIKKEQIFTFGQNFLQTLIKGEFLNPGNPAATEFGVGIRKVSQKQLEIYVVFV